MFRVADDTHSISGTSRMGDINVVYSDLVLAFGQPMESDGHKVSGEWVLVNEKTDEVFTIYDWKSTNLYDEDAPSVEEFRSIMKRQTFNIGGNHKGNVEEFKALVLAQIEWAKSGKPLEEALFGRSYPLVSETIKRHKEEL